MLYPVAPFTVLAQNSHNIKNLPYQNDVGNVKFGGFAPNDKVQGISLKRIIQDATIIQEVRKKVGCQTIIRIEESKLNF